ncbi:hypothetical protein J3R83DRAFT_2222 [Lanmaoa asiatica]|nr:hypothetical protein J3R83DRAFT_2222 [Lanmaoa asiatica]
MSRSERSLMPKNVPNSGSVGSELTTLLSVLSQREFLGGHWWVTWFLATHIGVRVPTPRASSIPDIVTVPRMSALSRPLRSVALAPALRSSRLRFQHPSHRPSLPLLHARFAASSVSGRPGSQTIKHARLNVKEEVGNSLTDWARSIAGGVFTVDSVKPTKDSFVSVQLSSTTVRPPRIPLIRHRQIGITTAVATTVPTPYLVMGLAGGLPYIASAGTTVYLSHQAGLAAAGTLTNLDPGVALTILDQALNFQVTYGAVLLSFLGASLSPVHSLGTHPVTGALHCGMEFAGLGGFKGYPRLLLGVSPAVVAWSTITLQPTSALLCQWLGFTALWYADNKATAAGWAPKWYSQYRFYLSILVGTCIIGSLAGTSYWGPVAGHGLFSHDLDLIRAERKRGKPERADVIPGDIEAVKGGVASDAYVVIRRKSKQTEDTIGSNGAKH